MAPGQFLVSFLDSFTPTEWLTIGLVLFAGASFWATYAQLRDTRARAAESRRIAVARVAAERFRQQQILSFWDSPNADVVGFALNGSLRPDAILERDPALLAEMLVSLGSFAGWVGQTAIQHAVSVAALARAYCQKVEATRAPGGPSMAISAIHPAARELVLDFAGRALEELRLQIVGLLRESIGSLDDALRQPLAAADVRTRKVIGPLSSETGRVLAREWRATVVNSKGANRPAS